MTPTTQRGVQSRPLQVTFFEDRAEVTRKATLTLPAGKSWVRLEGVTPFVDDRSVRAAPLSDEVTLLGVRVQRRLDEVRRGDSSEVREAATKAESLRAESQARESEVKEARRALSRLQELQGAWYAFPAGLAIQFNQDGSGLFGSAGGDDMTGIALKTRFEGELLQISFAGYQGESEECQTATGVYSVQRLAGGNIHFSPVQDDCKFRLDALNGAADLGFELTFHPLD